MWAFMWKKHVFLNKEMGKKRNEETRNEAEICVRSPLLICSACNFSAVMYSKIKYIANHCILHGFISISDSFQTFSLCVGGTRGAQISGLALKYDWRLQEAAMPLPGESSSLPSLPAWMNWFYECLRTCMHGWTVFIGSYFSGLSE